MPISLDEILEKRKAFSPDGNSLNKAFITKKNWNKDDRSSTFIMSAETEDRHGDIVIQKGIDKSHFENNPVSFFGHKSNETPIGTWSDIKTINGSPKRTEGKHTFVSLDVKDDLADRVARHVEFGSIKACSIGFRPKSAEWILDEDGNKTWGMQFDDIELFECSIVSIPAVREALMKGNGNIKDIMSPEVIEQFFENLKSAPDVASLCGPEFLEMLKFAEKEAKGNKTIGTVDIDLNASLIKSIETISDRVEELAAKLDKSTEPTIEPTEPEVDPVAKDIEDGANALVAKAEVDIEAISDDEARKGALLAIVDKVKGLFTPKDEIKLASQDEKYALAERFKKFEVSTSE